jgi:hypothetical protein
MIWIKSPHLGRHSFEIAADIFFSGFRFSGRDTRPSARKRSAGTRCKWLRFAAKIGRVSRRAEAPHVA